MQQQETIQINITCNSSAGGSDINYGSAKTQNTGRRKPFKGNGWSGSKKQRRLNREAKKKKTQKFKFYGVSIGRNGEKIHDTWAECEADVLEFKDALYKGFQSRIACIDWLRGESHKRQLKELLRKRRQEKEAEVSAVTAHVAQHDSDAHIPFAKATPIPTATPATTVHVCQPRPAPRERDFSPVAEMARLIASYPDGELPPPPVCSSRTCPCLCDEITQMQTILLQRLYQLAHITMQHNNDGINL